MAVKKKTCSLSSCACKSATKEQSYTVVSFEDDNWEIFDSKEELEEYLSSLVENLSEREARDKLYNYLVFAGRHLDCDVRSKGCTVVLSEADHD